MCMFRSGLIASQEVKIGIKLLTKTEPNHTSSPPRPGPEGLGGELVGDKHAAGRGSPARGVAHGICAGGKARQ